MARNEKRRQQVLQRKAAKRKQKKQALAQQPMAFGSFGGGSGTGMAPRGMAPPGQIRQAAGWPVHECLISQNWQTTEEITQVLVARRSPTGSIAAGVFLVDLACLGVKNALTRLCPLPADYQELRREIQGQQPLVPIDLNLAAKVVREAIDYAGRLGFKPHPDYRQAAPLLEGANPDAVATEIPLGKDGKPFFIAGPYDDAAKIIRQLTKAVGPPDNFHYVVPLGGTPDLFGEDDDEDEDGEDDDEGESEADEAARGASEPAHLPGWRRFLPGAGGR